MYEIRYIATVAGGCEMHVWCDPQSEGQRIPFPGSPYHVAVTAGKASPAVSIVDGWSKVHKEEKSDRHGKGADPSELYASDTVTLKPQIFDEHGNPTHLPEGAMSVTQKLPNGTEATLQCNIQSKGGQQTYEVRHDTSMAGTHHVHVHMFDTPIVGSPVAFTVLPDKPDPALCKLRPPVEETFIVDKEYHCVIHTFDKFNNKCIRGGLTPQVRLQLLKQGVHDQTQLVPGNHSCEVVDQNNGEYHVKFHAAIPCMFKMTVNIDKNLPSAGGELPPITIQIHSDPNAEPKGAEPAAAPEKQRRNSFRLRQAVSDVVQGFGAPEERREKDALLVAAEAFADGSKTFDFDASQAGNADTSPRHDLFDKVSPGPSPTSSWGSPSPTSSWGSPSKSRRGSVGSGRRKSAPGAASPTISATASAASTIEALGSQGAS